MHNSFSPLPDLYKLVISNEPDKSRKPLGTEIRRNIIVNRIIEIQDTPKLTIGLIIKMAQYGKVAERWAELYPQIRWRHNSNNRRFLRPHEQERLRGAIYRYWIYNTLFHDQTFVQFEPDLPSSREDPRLRILRTYTTLELVQLTEYLDKMRQVIQTDLYPSNAVVRHTYSEPVPPRTLANMGWGDGPRHHRLVLDVMKYNPAEVLHLYEKTSTKKERFEFLRAKGMGFWDMPATLRDTIAMVKFERKALLDTDAHITDEEIEYGIIDMPDNAGPGYFDRHRYARDASPDGSWIEGQQSGWPLWIPDGDDEEED